MYTLPCPIWMAQNITGGLLYHPVLRRAINIIIYVYYIYNIYYIKAANTPQ